MVVVGALLYTGTDPAAKQLSAIFTGSDTVRKLIDTNETDVRTLLDQMTTAVK
jgi:hypothetical protein